MSEIVQVWMLNNEIPVRIVPCIVEIGDCNLHTPILFVVELDMPMDTDGAHMAGALY